MRIMFLQVENNKINIKENQIEFLKVKNTVTTEKFDTGFYSFPTAAVTKHHKHRA